MTGCLPYVTLETMSVMPDVVVVADDVLVSTPIKAADLRAGMRYRDINSPESRLIESVEASASETMVWVKWVSLQDSMRGFRLYNRDDPVFVLASGTV